MINKALLTYDLKKIYEKKKIIFSFLLCIALYPIFVHCILEYDFQDVWTINLFYQNLGETECINSLLEYSQLLLNVGFIVFIVIYIFTLNIDVGKEMFFLRLSYNKWITYKVISEIIIVGVISIVEMIILTMIYLLFGMKLGIYSITLFLFYKIISNIILMFITIIFFLLSKKYFILIILSIYFIPVIFPNINFLNFIKKIIFCSNYCGIEILYIFVFLLIYIIVSKINIYKTLGGHK